MEQLETTFRIVTPLFLGGADPNEQAELREPSIKGVLRFWYRAIDQQYKDFESELFGGSSGEKGQSLFLLKIIGDRVADERWEGRNDLQYFAFPFNLQQTKRYIPENREFTLALKFKQSPNSEMKKRIIASLWLLGHFGGLGSRSRRGFGTVALTSWKIKDKSNWSEMNEVSIAHGAAGAENWINSLTQSLGILKQWFPLYQSQGADHAIISNSSRFIYLKNGAGNALSALANAAAIMQSFRNRRDVNNPASDYNRVKAHICANDEKAKEKGSTLATPVNPLHLRTSVDRSAFGLPLKFQYSSLEHTQKTDRNGPILKNGQPVMYPVSTMFQGQESLRSASRLHIRIIKIDKQYYPFFIQLDGPLLKNNERLNDRWGNYPQPSEQILDGFWQTLCANGEEVSW